MLSLGLVAAGLLYFASRVGVLQPGAGDKGLLALAGLALVLVARRADPAWLLSLGILSTVFAGHWALLGLNSTVGPDRVLLAVGAVALVLSLGRARNRPPIRFTSVHYLMVAALVYALISAIMAGTLARHYAQFALLDQFGALPFFMFLIAPVAFATDRQRRILLGVLVAAGAYLSLTALLEKLGVTALVIPSYVSDPSVGIHFGRARGPFVDAGADGLALCGCVIAAGIAYVTWRRPLTRAVAAGVVGLGLVGVLLTETRGVWLAGAVALVVTLATTRKLQRFLIPGVAAGVVLVIGAFSVIPGLGQQVQQRLNDQASVYERQNTTAAGLRMVQARPLLGFGWARGDDYIASYFRVNPNIPLTGAVAGFHNIYLEYAVTLGLVGVGLWLLTIGSAFLAALTSRVPPDIEPWQVGVKAMLVAWVVIGLTAPSDYIFSTVLLWTMGGIAYGTRFLPQPPESDATR